MFDTINALKPYFYSLREIQGKVSLDIKIPVQWKNGEEPNKEVQFKIQDQNDKNTLLSIISVPTKEGYDAVFTVAKKIIKTNLEEEEKVRLFNAKVEELKKLFLDSPLDKLKEISFTKDNVRNKKSTGEIGLGDQEGSGDSKSA